jgi:type I restriction enzyme M protein
MSAAALQDIEKLEASLWEAADNLRANSKLTSSEYVMPVLGVIFLRHASNRYEAARRQIEADQAAGKMPNRAPVKADFLKRRALMLPVGARYDELLKLPKGSNFGTALVNAMNAIEADFEPLLNQLPKDYEKFGGDLLEDLLRIFDSETLRTASGDVFGRIYEYFLMKFAMQGAQDNGEFFTPPSLVQMLVNIIEPDHGVVFDPACGSGGMFVQSSHFIEREGANTSHRVTFYGQEKTATTIRLAKMNLAVHGLEGDIREANTFYEDVHNLFAKCDFVIANPPFNVDMVDAEKVKDDRRLPFGLPGVNKEKKVSNGNYLWISYFHSYLGPTGRAGFVMSSQASSAGHGEAQVRRKLIETGSVDVMIAIRSNFFYTRAVPCELWSLDNGKPTDRQDQVLMIDARNVYRKVTRKIYDFSPEQLQNLSAIVWLYRGDRDRFRKLVQSYRAKAVAAATAASATAGGLHDAISAITVATGPFLESLPAESPLRAQRTERDMTIAAAFASLDGVAADVAQIAPAKRESQQKRVDIELGALAAICRDAIKEVDLAARLTARLISGVEQNKAALRNADWDSRAISQLAKELEDRRERSVEQLTSAVYFERQAHWLTSRFPDAQFAAVPGLCRAVPRADIQQADWILSPGRYVGTAPAEVDDDFDFAGKLREIHVELADLNADAARLSATIQEQLARLGS